MKTLIESIVRELPKEIKNSQLIKRQDIYIPFREIGIECLTKDTTDISLFYEIILKFVDIGIYDINEIALIMGIEYKLIKEVVVDMIENQFISTSQNRIYMTKRGKDALESRKIVTIQKKNINKVMVNMITGMIEESNHVTVSQVSSRDICLNETFSITKDFLENNYTRINEIYQNNQIESSIFQMRHVSRELYKILDVSYDKLCFIKTELLIYKNNDSDDFEFVISKDTRDEYINAFYEQIRDVVYPGLENIFEKDRNFARSCSTYSLIEDEEKKQTEKLKQMLVGCDAISDEIFQEFVKTRSIIDNKEIEKFFEYHQAIKCDGIIVSSKRIKNLLNKSIINVLTQESDKKIVIIYDENEYGIERILKKVFSSEYSRKNVLLVKEDTPKEFICFYPNVLINLTESITYIFNNPITILDGKISFDAKSIKNKMDEILKNYHIKMHEEKRGPSNYKKKHQLKKFKKGYRKNHVSQNG